MPRVTWIIALAAIVWSAAALALWAQLAAPAPAAAVRVWTSDVACNELDPKAVKELKAITLIGVRNGSFSGKVVVESAQEIKGLQAAASALTGTAGTMAASQVQLRYAKQWDVMPARNRPGGVDILLDTAPDITAVRNRIVATVWVTVNVPKDAKAGTYAGEVTVQAAGLAPVRVKINLEVADWTLPDPQEYRIWTDFMESPDTLALEYKVPLWSEKHWQLIDRSFKLLSPTGSRVVYVPLITGTNFGNEQSMVRWIKKGENQYDYDYTVLDRYLDSAEKNLGKPKLVIFPVWDIYLSQDALKRGLWGGENDTRKSREELLGKGPRVTVLNPATKEASVEYLPRYEDAASKALWQPLFAGVIQRMKKRGLEKTLMLGTMPDLWPNKEEVAFWDEISGGRPWVIHAHGGPLKDVAIGQKGLYQIADIGYAASVNGPHYAVNPDKGRQYGWQSPAFVSIYQRFELNNDSPAFIREFQAFNLTGGFRGAGRMGADYWPALRNKNGERAGQVYARYPENNWRNLDIGDWFLAPGPDGAVATARLEYLREGNQVCEAKIFLEDALLDAGKKAKLGPELAQRCQEALDEHQRAMWKTVWNDDEDLNRFGIMTVRGGAGRNPAEALWFALDASGKALPKGPGAYMAYRTEEARKGTAWFVLGWQEREKKLFALAGQVAARLGTK